MAVTASLRPRCRHGNKAGGSGARVLPEKNGRGVCVPLPAYVIITVTLDGLDWLLISLFRAKSVKLPPNCDNNAFAYFQF